VASVIVQMVKFKSGLSEADLERVMKDRAPRFRAIPGLIQKYYGREKATGALAGIYLWDSEESLRQYQGSELRRTIAEAYAAEGTPRVEIFDVLYQLRS
jgi:heme-degrading monooxygenase HmoA